MSYGGRVHRRFPDIDIIAGPDRGMAMRFPRPMLALTIPLTDQDAEAVIVLPRTMLETEWDQMMATLAVMHSGIVE